MEQSADTSPYKLQAFQEVGDILYEYSGFGLFPLTDSARQGRN